MADVIDLRSDTVSLPTPEMRRAMAKAVVGDDVYGEDPTVNRLEARAAEMFGQQAGLFVASGTQGNLIAMLAHAGRGNEVILGDKAHIFLYEQGGLAALGGIIPHTLPVQPDGTLSLASIRQAIRVDNIHFPRTKVIALENTQGTVGGVPLSPAYVQEVAELAHGHGLKLHIDGARIFNAATYYGVTPQEIMGGADSLSCCLSKGLCAPVGSLLVGSSAFIAEARRYRKLLGGGMRQAGVLAAAGLIALDTMSMRLQEDHDNAAYLAARVSEFHDLQLLSQHTNFTFFQLKDSAGLTAEEFSRRLQEQQILLRPYHGNDGRFRAVTHHGVNRHKIDTVIAAARTILEKVPD